MSSLVQSSLMTQSLTPTSSSKPRRPPLAFPVRNLRRYLAMLSRQVTAGATLIIKRPFTPPPIPNWPLHLALFVAVVQATADLQEHIVDDLSDIRFVIDTFFYYLPKLPQMTIFPFKLTIPAQGRGFQGVLAPLEEAENGHRTLPGQWISDSKVWQRIMQLPPANSAMRSKDPYAAREGEQVIAYYHGGGYFICSTATHRELLWRISKATGCRIFAVDYRLAPENVYPSALSDAAHAFAHLTDPVHGCGFDPRKVTVAGDSAGGGLSVALLMYQRDQGLATAANAFLLSPWLDLTMSCESWLTNTDDYLPAPPQASHNFNPISFYCSGKENIKTMAKHPYISPLYGHLEGLPPLLIQCGEEERLRDECILFTYKAGGCLGSSQRNKLPFQPLNPNLDQARNQVELDMYPGMVHVFQAIPFLPESGMAMERMREFMQRIGARQAAEEASSSIVDKIETLASSLAESTAAKTALLMDPLPAYLQLREDDERLEMVEEERLSVMA